MREWEVEMVATLHALQHIFSSVERGYFPRQGRGFQTVAVAAELVGTEDLRVLEEAAFYALSRERRSRGKHPIKETFFRLPSGRFAIGRSVDWGTDPLGREGNYLTHHVVLDRDDLIKIGANPFAILDTMQLATAEIDLTPRALPPLVLEVALVQSDFSVFDKLNPDLLASVAIATVDGGEKTALLIGDETQSRALLRGLFATLAVEERLRLTFSTHFYESNHLRSLFALVTVGSPAEAPSQRQDYIAFDLIAGRFSQLAPASAYAAWLAECLQSRRWEEVSALNRLLNTLRGSHDDRRPDSLPTGPRACAALCERAGTAVAQALLGEPQSLIEFLRHVPSPNSLADALLAVASPSVLCGADTTPETITACLSALQSAATSTGWRSWVKQWIGDPMLASFLSKKRPWWLRWK